jgi:glycosyltransferase involved in cell wall biosynthesis
MTRLIIQIPCFNERNHLEGTIRALPRHIAGVDSIEILVIDDGSCDGTLEKALDCGVHYIVRFPQHRGLAAAYLCGIETAVQLGADIVVNTDADNQYVGRFVADLVLPIVERRADIVVGNRGVATEPNFSPIKRFLQRIGSRLVSKAAGLDIADCTSGFRAMSREAAAKLFVHNGFSYTLETLLQAGQAGLAVGTVPIQTNPPTRESRLFKSIPQYVRRNVPVIVRGYAMYHPLITFGIPALIFVLIGSVLIGRFLVLFALAPSHSGHVQSLLAGVGSVVLGAITAMMALLGDLIAANRRLSERILFHLRSNPLVANEVSSGSRLGVDIIGTEARPWTQDNKEQSALMSAAERSLETSTTSTVPAIPSPAS